MSILKLLVMIVFVTVVNAPFTVDGAAAKTYLGVSGISPSSSQEALSVGLIF